MAGLRVRPTWPADPGRRPGRRPARHFAPPPGYLPPMSGYGQPQYGYPPPGFLVYAGAPGAYGYPGVPVPGGRRASMGARFGGLLLDFMIVAVPTVLIGVLVGGFHTTHTTTCDTSGACGSGINLTAGWVVYLIALAWAIAPTSSA